MDISSECRMRHYRDDEHREDSPYFNNGSLPDFETHPYPISIRVKLGLGQFQIRVRVNCKLGLGIVPNWRIHPIFILIILKA